MKKERLRKQMNEGKLREIRRRRKSTKKQKEIKIKIRPI
jgi:hypothetical protein